MYQRAATSGSSDSTATDSTVSTATAPYELIYSDKSHSRIIHSLSFSSDEKWLATGARDKRVKIHSLVDGNKVVLTKLLATPITAIAFAPSVADSHKYTLVVGYEEGKLEVYEFDSVANQLNYV